MIAKTIDISRRTKIFAIIEYVWKIQGRSRKTLPDMTDSLKLLWDTKSRMWDNIRQM